MLHLLEAKHIVFTLSLPVLFALSLTSELIVPYLVSTTALCFGVHTVYPNSVSVTIPFLDWINIVVNIIVSSMVVSMMFQYIPKDSVYSTEGLWNVSTVELGYIVLWVVSDEILFFFGHKLLHTPTFYKIHKIHHKYKITNCWTTFYSHPLDNLFVICAAIALPMIMMHNGFRFSASTVALYLHMATVTFIASHHTKQCNSKIIDTPHLIHHKMFNANLGNFWILDYLFNSHNEVK